MNVLLVNLHSSSNAGDNVLLRVMLAEIRRTFPGCEITLSMSDSTSYEGTEPVVGSFTSWYKSISYDDKRWRPLPLMLAPWHLLCAAVCAVTLRVSGRAILLPLPSAQRDLLDAYAHADLIVTNAGGYLYSSGRVGLPFLLQLASVAYGTVLGKPVYGMPQTIGPIRRGYERSLLHGVLSRARLTLLRDEGSLLELSQGRRHTVSAAVTPDLAFAYDEQDESGADRLFARVGLDARHSPLLGVTVVNWGDQNLRFHTQTAYEKAVARAIRAWIGLTGGHAILFPQVCGPLAADDDRIPAARVAGLLDDLASHVHHVHTAEPPDVLRAAYGRMDLFLATRLHSAIFTMTMGVPVAAIAYQDKTYGALRLLGLERWAIPIEQAGDDSVESLLLDAWESRRVIQSTIATGLPALRANSQLAANLIRRDFELLNPDLRP